MQNTFSSANRGLQGGEMQSDTASQAGEGHGATVTNRSRSRTINLTQHDTTPEQRADGVVDRLHPGLLSDLLTFDKLPSPELIAERAEAIARLAVSVYERWEIPAGTRDSDASDWPQAMIGGAPFLMAALERSMISYRICPVYAFSVRESVEANQPDGSVRKVAIFRHLGLVQPPLE